jgi:hypothetical protein
LGNTLLLIIGIKWYEYHLPRLTELPKSAELITL